MDSCEHGKVCAKYYEEWGIKLSVNCTPDFCPFFKQNNSKQLADTMENIARALDKIARRVK